MYQPRRQSGTRWLMVFMLSVIVFGCFLIYWSLNTESVKRRIEAIPFYARAYVNQFRPTPEIPAPPAVSAIAPETLLQATSSENGEPGQSGDTPAYFNEASLNPTESSNQSADTVALVQSSTLSPKPIAPQVALTGLTHQWQTWNNCGPVTITMNLSYYGRTETQVDAAPVLKPNKDDKNVSPYELAAYARTLGYEAVVRVGGNLDLLKQLLSNDLPVIVETWLNPEDKGGLGHYRLFTGYDDGGGYFIAKIR
jgi:hypothetical protein